MDDEFPEWIIVLLVLLGLLVLLFSVLVLFSGFKRMEVECWQNFWMH
jgi:hypothetical protein